MATSLKQIQSQKHKLAPRQVLNARLLQLSLVNLEQTINFAKSIPHPVIASGGVSSLNDISRLAKEFSNGVQGVIVGRALYDKKFTFSDALQKIKEVKI